MTRTAKTEAIKEKANSATDAASAAKSEAESSIKDAASEAARQAKKVREDVADAAGEKLEAAREALNDFEPDTLINQAAGRLADNLSDAANAIRTTDLKAVRDDVAGFARRNPLLFFGGAALLGFAAARMLKNSGSDAELEAAEAEAEAAWGYSQ